MKRTGRSRVSAITHTPASGPFGPRTTPPMSSSSIATAAVAVAVAVCCAPAGTAANARNAASAADVKMPSVVSFLRMLDRSLVPGNYWLLLIGTRRGYAHLGTMRNGKGWADTAGEDCVCDALGLGFQGVNKCWQTTASELSGEMASREVAAAPQGERRNRLGADRLRDRAARAENATRRRVDRARRLAGEREALALAFRVGIGDRHRRDQIARVGMQRGGEQ